MYFKASDYTRSEEDINKEKVQPCNDVNVWGCYQAERTITNEDNTLRENTAVCSYCHLVDKIDKTASRLDDSTLSLPLFSGTFSLS